jgi:hypothetical protein
MKMVETYLQAQKSDNPTIKTLVDLIERELNRD